MADGFDSGVLKAVREFFSETEVADLMMTIPNSGLLQQHPYETPADTTLALMPPSSENNSHMSGDNDTDIRPL